MSVPFRQLEDLNGEGQDGKIVKNREFTDKAGFGTLAVYLVIVLSLMIYTASQGDIYRLLNGYDNCGNVCGRPNKQVDGIECSGQDMTQRNYLLSQNITTSYGWYINKECLEKCPSDYEAIFHRCIPVSGGSEHNSVEEQNFLKLITQDLSSNWVKILLMCFLALVYSVIMVFLFRYATKFVVWFMLIGGILLFLGITIGVWVGWSAAKNSPKEEERQSAPALMFFAIFMSILTVGIIILVLVMRKRIQLVIRLIKEAGKAIGAMPAILFEPVLTFIAAAIGCSIWVYFMMLASNAGTLRKTDQFVPDGKKLYEFMDGGAVGVSIVMAWVCAIWMFYFIIDCQHMIIAGAISRWFFTRNKAALGSPILSSFHTTCRFHLGTIALGSLIVTIFHLIKTAIKSAMNNNNRNAGAALALLKACIGGCLEMLEDLLKYFTKNAYIVTAIYGYGFCKAGKRAYTVIKNNIFNIIVINQVGDTVLALAKLVILLLTGVVAFEVLRHDGKAESYFVSLIIIIVFAACIGHMFMTVYEMAIDTLFVCFCEDQDENDGMAKPYYMSKDLLEFVENSHKLLDKGQREENQTVNV